MNKVSEQSLILMEKLHALEEEAKNHPFYEDLKKYRKC